MTTTTMPEHVQAYSWGTGRETWYGCTYERNEKDHPRNAAGEPVSLDGHTVCDQSWNITHNIYGLPVPDPESPAYLADVLNGLLAQQLQFKFWPQNREGTDSFGVHLCRESALPIRGYGPTPNAALIAAVLKAKEAQK